MIINNTQNNINQQNIILNSLALTWHLTSLARPDPISAHGRYRFHYKRLAWGAYTESDTVRQEILTKGKFLAWTPVKLYL